MKKIGFIGYGSMSSMLVSKMLQHQTLKEEQIYIYSRSQHEGVSRFKNCHPAVTLTSTADELAANCDVVFICVKPFDVKEVVKGIAPRLTSVKHVISIAAGVTTEQLARLISAPVSKLMPSVTSEVDAGVSLVVHHEQVTEQQKEALTQMLEAFSLVKVIHEQDLDAATNLTGSSPAYFSAICETFVEATLSKSQLRATDAYEMVLEALLGTAQLLKQKQMTFAETIDRVATKGGITEEGVNILQAHLPPAFDELVTRTLDKYTAFQKQVDMQ
ncbi:pyrroline-5-carboxylate reductase 3 [Pullulanibacillus camelliae]|uniref:Pyrroline-5-carboxylate reductase n=1 Tax=Pullulanibacillus camelliae TaxID=1707096 RepID=A0A8J2VRR0_9BACL|nr:pyrroline-5-carboxylate reductase ProG [Pullulanibacillus camelliae]GGE38106.1 pyrroline-5-carboxylate reductase 3 [Pullulanibacillus camelliae]